ncbi:MAG: glycosyltransferase family 9 protein [Candidatus Omnitrophota bacterium]|nr:glycosyltransferase family 9 protein [Candidatus Omnitrophota bacterium]
MNKRLMNLIEIIRYVVKQAVESIEYIVWNIVLFRAKDRTNRLKVNGRIPKKILLVQLNSIGDVLMSTPVLKSLRDRFTGSEIGVLTLPHTAVLLEKDPCVDRIFTYVDRFWRKMIFDPRLFRNSVKTIKLLKKTRYDLCIDLGGTFGSVICALLSDAACVVGPKREVKSGVFKSNTRNFYNRAVELKQKHILRQYLEITAEFGCSASIEKEKFYISEQDKKKAEMFFEENGLEKENFVAMHPGAKWPPKRWPAEYFARLVKMMFDGEGLITVLVGSPSDEPLLKAIKDKTEIPQTVLACDLGLGELGVVISRSRVFVGNDSGPAHIAAGVGAPSVLLFGPTDPETCAPVADRNIVLHNRISCWPCTLYYRRDRCESGENECLKNIDPEKVHAATKELMEG